MNSAQVCSAVEMLDRIELSTADGSRCTDILTDIRGVRGWLDAIEARVASRIAELHRSADGAPVADVLARAGGMSAAEGRRRERRSDTLDRAPAFADRLADGEVGVEHVDLLAGVIAHCPDHVRDALLDAQHELADAAASLSPEHFGRHVRTTVRQLERSDGLERNQRQRRDSFFSHQINMATGMIEGRFAFHPELANQILTPLNREIAAMIAESEQAVGHDTSAGAAEALDDGRTVDRRRLAAEALGRLVAGGHQQRRPAIAEITVIVDADTLTTGTITGTTVCETGDGLELPVASVARLMCEGTVTPIIVDADGSVLAAGRSIRHANRTQRQALRAMYRTCSIDTCDVPFDQCEIHHVTPWGQGGRTDLDAIAPLCSRHHHVVHDHGWVLQLSADRTLTVRRPDGSESTSRPDMVEQRTQARLRPTGT